MGKVSEIFTVIKNEMNALDKTTSFDEVGEVIKVYDGIAIVYGLDNVQFNEIVEFSNGIQGVVFNIEDDNVGIVILGYENNIEEKSIVKRTKKYFEVPTGKSLL